MEIPSKLYKITLPKGRAKKSFFDLTEAEQLAVGVRIFERAKKAAEEIGEEPAIIKRSTQRVRLGI